MQIWAVRKQAHRKGNPSHYFPKGVLQTETRVCALLHIVYWSNFL